jgi:hypothetical protein
VPGRPSGLSITPRSSRPTPRLRRALPPGRGDRAPPRKSSFALFPGSPRKATSPWLIPPEGRAPHAREKRLRLTEACILLATGPSFTPDHHAIPGHASAPFFAGAETAPLRENHSWRHFGAFPARRPTLRFTSPRRGGLRTPAKKAPASPGHIPVRPPPPKAQATCPSKR